MKYLPTLVAAVAVLALPTTAHAQHAGRPGGPGGHGGHGGDGASHGNAPYAGWQDREVKSLSDGEMADLRAGRGMSLALSAELNGYPGPTHVLELAEHLELTPEQRAAAEAMLAEMKAAAAEGGAELVRAERAVDALFAGGQATEAALAETVRRAAAARGRLRVVHLRYHLRMMAVLTPDQVATYNRMRGYI